MLYGLAGEGPAPDTATAAVAAKELLRSGDFHIEGELAALPELADGLLLSFPALLDACPPVGGRPLVDRLVEARGRIDELDFDAALAALEQGSPFAACVGEVQRESLYDLFFLAGYARFFSDDRPDAERLFALAAAVDPGRRWNDELPPTAKGAFLDALQATLEASAPAVDTREVVGLTIDGREVDPERAASLLPGVHMLRVGGRTFVLRLPAAGDAEVVRLIPAESLRSALLRGEPWTTPIMARLVAAHGWDDVVLVSDLGSVWFRRGAWVGPGLEVAAPVAPGGPPPARIAGVVLLGSGAAVAALGFGLHGQAWQAGGAIEEDPRAADRPSYEALHQRNIGGFVTGVAGTVVAATGLVLALVPPPDPAARVAVRPFAAGGRDGLSVGLVGRFR